MARNGQVESCRGKLTARTQTTQANFSDDPILGWIVISENIVRFLQVLVLALLSALVPVVGLRWRHQAFGIATGLVSTQRLLFFLRPEDDPIERNTPASAPQILEEMRRYKEFIRRVSKQ